MRVAIVHYWLIKMRGGEKVLENLCRIYPDADIYTHVYNKNKISRIINNHTIKTTFIQYLPFSIKLLVSDQIPLFFAPVRDQSSNPYKFLKILSSSFNIM